MVKPAGKIFNIGEYFIGRSSHQGPKTEEMRGYSCQGLDNPGMRSKAEYL